MSVPFKTSSSAGPQNARVTAERPLAWAAAAPVTVTAKVMTYVTPRTGSVALGHPQASA